MNKQPFEVGDLVTSDYYPKDASVIRRITKIYKAERTDAWLVSADAGEPCKCCGAYPSKPIVGGMKYGVDSLWFRKIEQ